MRIFVAGGTGAVGKRLVPLLVAEGHDVTATTRSRDKFAAIERMGAKPAAMDGLDGASVREAVIAARPDVIVHQMTDLSAMADLKNFERELARTNRLRTDGTENLLAAARLVGTKRVVAQSYTGWPNARVGGRVKSESDPLDLDPPKSMASTLEAIRTLETRVLGFRDVAGTVLRYGAFYGPGTSIADDGSVVALVRAGKLPLVGDGGAVWSFLHVDDAASATLRAIEHGAKGLYNVADDDPAEVRVWLPELASIVGGPAPKRVPSWLARFAIGKAGVVMMAESRGSSNAKIKNELGWTPRYASWREGFRTGLRDAVTAPVEATTSA